MDKINFKLSRETKGTFVYEEDPPDGKPPVVGVLYIRKWALGKTPPKAITVTVEQK